MAGRHAEDSALSPQPQQAAKYGAAQIRAALADVVRALAEPENRARIAAAREAAGNEMLRTMQCVFPAVVRVEAEVIARHGFPAGREGMVRFAQGVREAERHDAEVARLHAQVRAHYLPPLEAGSGGAAAALDQQLIV